MKGDQQCNKCKTQFRCPFCAISYCACTPSPRCKFNHDQHPQDKYQLWEWALKVAQLTMARRDWISRRVDALIDDLFHHRRMPQRSEESKGSEKMKKILDERKGLKEDLDKAKRGKNAPKELEAKEKLQEKNMEAREQLLRWMGGIDDAGSLHCPWCDATAPKGSTCLDGDEHAQSVRDMLVRLLQRSLKFHLLFDQKSRKQTNHHDFLGRLQDWEALLDHKQKLAVKGAVKRKLTDVLQKQSLTIRKANQEVQLLGPAPTGINKLLDLRCGVRNSAVHGHAQHVVKKNHPTAPQLAWDLLKEGRGDSKDETSKEAKKNQGQGEFDLHLQDLEKTTVRSGKIKLEHRRVGQKDLMRQKCRGCGQDIKSRWSVECIDKKPVVTSPGFQCDRGNCKMKGILTFRVHFCTDQHLQEGVPHQWRDVELKWGCEGQWKWSGHQIVRWDHGNTDNGWAIAKDWQNRWDFKLGREDAGRRARVELWPKKRFPVVCDVCGPEANEEAFVDMVEKVNAARDIAQRWRDMYEAVEHLERLAKIPEGIIAADISLVRVSATTMAEAYCGVLFDEFGCEVATHGEEVERLDCEDDAPAAEVPMKNEWNFPIREAGDDCGEVLECWFYSKFGWCKFGGACSQTHAPNIQSCRWEFQCLKLSKDSSGDSVQDQIFFAETDDGEKLPIPNNAWPRNYGIPTAGCKVHCHFEPGTKNITAVKVRRDNFRDWGRTGVLSQTHQGGKRHVELAEFPAPNPIEEFGWSGFWMLHDLAFPLELQFQRRAHSANVVLHATFQPVTFQRRDLNDAQYVSWSLEQHRRRGNVPTVQDARDHEFHSWKRLQAELQDVNSCLNSLSQMNRMGLAGLQPRVSAAFEDFCRAIIVDAPLRLLYALEVELDMLRNPPAEPDAAQKWILWVAKQLLEWQKRQWTTLPQLGNWMAPQPCSKKGCSQSKACPDCLDMFCRVCQQWTSGCPLCKRRLCSCPDQGCDFGDLHSCSERGLLQYALEKTITEHILCKETISNMFPLLEPWRASLEKSLNLGNEISKHFQTALTKVPKVEGLESLLELKYGIRCILVHGSAERTLNDGLLRNTPSIATLTQQLTNKVVQSVAWGDQGPDDPAMLGQWDVYSVSGCSEELGSMESNWSISPPDGFRLSIWSSQYSFSKSADHFFLQLHDFIAVPAAMTRAQLKGGEVEFNVHLCSCEPADKTTAIPKRPHTWLEVKLQLKEELQEHDGKKYKRKYFTGVQRWHFDDMTPVCCKEERIQLHKSIAPEQLDTEVTEAVTLAKQWRALFEKFAFYERHAHTNAFIELIKADISLTQAAAATMCNALVNLFAEQFKVDKLPAVEKSLEQAQAELQAEEKKVAAEAEVAAEDMREILKNFIEGQTPEGSDQININEDHVRDMLEAQHLDADQGRERKIGELLKTLLSANLSQGPEIESAYQDQLVAQFQAYSNWNRGQDSIRLSGHVPFFQSKGRLQKVQQHLGVRKPIPHPDSNLFTEQENVLRKEGLKRADRPTCHHHNCQFQVIANALGSDPRKIRELAVQWLHNHRDDFKFFVEGSWSDYLAKMGGVGSKPSPGDHLTLQALAEHFKRSIVLFRVNGSNAESDVENPWSILVPDTVKPNSEPIQLLVYAGTHYDHYEALEAVEEDGNS